MKRNAIMAPGITTRILAYLATWAVAWMLLPYPFGLLPYFPIGLFFVNPSSPDIETRLSVAGWCIYVIHALFFFLVRPRTLYIAAYIILALLLATNVVGCHVFIHRGMNNPNMQ